MYIGSLHTYLSYGVLFLCSLSMAMIGDSDSTLTLYKNIPPHGNAVRTQRSRIDLLARLACCSLPPSPSISRARRRSPFDATYSTFFSSSLVVYALEKGFFITNFSFTSHHHTLLLCATNFISSDDASRCVRL